ncbi:carbohydrate ABC transporter permease [Alicyclobacillus fodiniaquatilis]|uniref:Carbohydrate ABC transporter permease n=1 Tax=Alicyclobacillus fodiniaquatilis TaxID=1661150 RepID=A0ABW4JKA0_9BACL
MPRIAHTQKSRDTVAGYLFTAPVTLGVLIWTFIPMVLSLFYAFTKYNVLTPPKFIGLSNFSQLFHDPTFMNSLEVTVIYTIISVPVGLLVGLLLAVLLNQNVLGMRLFRTIFYLPAVVPIVAGTQLWTVIFSPSKYGIVNMLLMKLHIVSKPFPFFTEPHTSMFSLILMGLWSAGGGMLIWLAGLKSVPPELYEAAHIDGANSWSRFMRVTIPILTPTIFYNLIMGMIGALQVFASSFVLGGVNGAPLGSLDFVNVFIYRNAFNYFKMGYASAAAWILFIIILFLTLIVFRTSKGWVHYGGGQD